MQRLLGILFIAAFSFMAASTAPRIADACNGSPIGYYIEAPADGDESVPLNAHVFLRWHNLSSNPSEIYLFDGQNRIDLIAESLPWARPYISTVRLTPSQALTPLTVYEIISDGGADYVIATFKTGSEMDDAAPSRPQIGDVTIAPMPSRDDADECGSQYLVRRFAFAIGVASEEPVVYEVTEGDQVLASAASAPLVGVVNCADRDNNTADYHETFEVAPGAHALRISAVDRAGNRSDPVEIAFYVDCPPESFGCRTGSGGSSASWLLSVCALAHLCWRRRC